MLGADVCSVEILHISYWNILFNQYIWYTIGIFFPVAAKASCQSALDTARNIVADVGPGSAASSGG